MPSILGRNPLFRRESAPGICAGEYSFRLIGAIGAMEDVSATYRRLNDREGKTILENYR